jgi:hypothetical protein
MCTNLYTLTLTYFYVMKKERIMRSYKAEYSTDFNSDIVLAWLIF